MKKVLALVLAVMMLATVAFAADTTNPGDDGIGNDPSRWKPGKTIKITALGIIKETEGAYNFIDSGKGEAGEDFKIIKDLNSTNYTIQSVKYDDGKAMVSSVSFNDKENRVEIKLKKDFTTTKGKKLDMTFTLKGKKVGKTKPANIEVRVFKTINYFLDENTLIIDPDNELPKNLDFSDDTVIYKVKPEKNAAGTTIGASYGTLEFTANGDDEVDVPGAALGQQPLEILPVLLCAGQGLVCVHPAVEPAWVVLDEAAVVADLGRKGVEHGVLAGGHSGVGRDPCCLGLGRNFQSHFLNNAFQKITSLVVTYSL